MTAAPHFEVIQTDADQAWHVRIVGANGEIILAGEPLSGFDDAKDAVLAVSRMFVDMPDLMGQGDPVAWYVTDNRKRTGADVVYKDQREPQHEVPD